MGKAVTGEEFPVLGAPKDHFAFLTSVANDIRFHDKGVFFFFDIHLNDQFVQLNVVIPYQILPDDLTLFDLIKFVLHLGGETNIEDLIKLSDQKAVYIYAQRGRQE